MARRVLARLLGPVLVLNLVAQVVIVVTGGVVRLTGSGLGCPTWPQCVPGSYTPVVQQAQGWHKDVEFGNRMLTFVVGVAAVAVVVCVTAWVLRTGAPAGSSRSPRCRSSASCCRPSRRHHRADRPRAGGRRGALPRVDGARVGVVVLLLALRRPGGGRPSASRSARSPAALAVVAAVVLALGTVVTGSGPHSGDAETRRGSGSTRDRWPGCMPTPCGCSSGSCWR